MSLVLIWGPFVPATQQSSHITDFQKCTVCFNIQAKCTESSETQELSVGPGEKVQQEFSSIGGRAPGYPNSPDTHFQMVKWMLPPDWAQKCFVLLSWICKQKLLSTGIQACIDLAFINIREFKIPRRLMAVKTLLEKWLCIFSIFIIIIPSRLLRQMQANSDLLELNSFQPYPNSERERKVCHCLYSRPPQHVEIGIFTW